MWYRLKPLTIIVLVLFLVFISVLTESLQTAVRIRVLPVMVQLRFDHCLFWYATSVCLIHGLYFSLLMVILVLTAAAKRGKMVITVHNQIMHMLLSEG